MVGCNGGCRRRVENYNTPLIVIVRDNARCERRDQNRLGSVSLALIDAAR